MMYKKLVRACIPLTALALAPVALASPLSDYNLIVSGDYTYSGSTIWGHTVIGGDLKGNGGEFATRLPRDTTDDSLIVVGDITSSNINLQAGNLVYGGDIYGTTITNNGQGTIRQDTTLNVDNLINELISESIAYSNQDANGTFNSSNNTFEYSGTGSVAYFDVNATDVFKQNANIKLNSGNAETVVINVAGSSITAAGGVNFDFNSFKNQYSEEAIDATNILWNFYEALSLDLGDFGFVGSVLAINAEVTGIGTLDGSLAAASLVGDRQIHNLYFKAPPVVPLPASLQFMLLGLAGMLLTKLGMRNRRKISA